MKIIPTILMAMVGMVFMTSASHAQTVCPAIYQPVCVERVVVCVRAPCPPIQETVQNACVARQQGLKILYRGKCRPNRPSPCDRNKPVCAYLPVVCVQAPCPQRPLQLKTFKNRCQAKKAGYTVAYRGRCRR